jgi:hypothetical protein
MIAQPERHHPMSEETFAKICERIAKGDTTFVACRKEGYTDACLFHRMKTSPEKQKAYRLARKKHADAYLDRFLATLDETETKYQDGKHTCIDNAIIAKRKVQLDATRFYLTMVDGKRYGTKRDTETHRKLPGWKGTVAEKMAYVDETFAKGHISPETAKLLYSMIETQQKITDVQELASQMEELKTNPALQEILKAAG